MLDKNLIDYILVFGHEDGHRAAIIHKDFTRFDMFSEGIGLQFSDDYGNSLGFPEHFRELYTDELQYMHSYNKSEWLRTRVGDERYWPARGKMGSAL